MAAASAESLLKMSMAATSNASSLCNCNGFSRRSVPPLSPSTRRRIADSASRARALTSSFLGTMRFSPEPAKMSPFRHKQLKNNFSVFAMAAGIRDRLDVKSKATGESSEASIVKSVQNVWDKSEDRVALIGLGFAGVVGLWAAINLVSAIDKVPLVPGFLELVGIVYSSWFTYRYLLYKPDREELFQTINKSISDILGQ
ncbi:protein CURVATURE THYLAKOID 1A, chloroplastic [Henckelia pumila]|uniref:protein CURVATURE THYLAKOID 1A, chloroplastic n=1 Tax=Henckelia pumila TaxID=405737 RepID=UPI003C6E5D6F